ncbi:MAG: hypothetical protein HYS17_06180 [Micavibrio aeruginosavorus]|uniref:Uncharacterized protein n=1 Tax=Micavibrio aeruginosavorus TaxID=349221 RepID=A0A7T5R0C1_9BACT|nr:MAG: hypothetical protein HYS17_06180 [Micavibrio aeruginosavorus]
MDVKENSPDELGALEQVQSVLPFDAERYMANIADLDMTYAQKVEFLRVLWDIMSAFVDLGFGVDSVIPIIAKRASESCADALQQAIPKHEFNVAVDDGAKGDAE